MYATEPDFLLHMYQSQGPASEEYQLDMYQDSAGLPSSSVNVAVLIAYVDGVVGLLQHIYAGCCAASCCLLSHLLFAFVVCGA